MIFQVTDQQLGCVWSKNDHLVSVSLSGNIHYLDPRAPGSFAMTVEGHNKPITAVSRRAGDHKTLVTADSEGRVVAWQTEQGVGRQVRGRGPANQINGVQAEEDGTIMVAGIDDTLR